MSWENSLTRPHEPLKLCPILEPPDQNTAAIHWTRQLDRGGIGSLKAHTAEIGKVTYQQDGSLPSSLSGFAGYLDQPRAKALAAKVWVDSEGAQKDQGCIAYMDWPQTQTAREPLTIIGNKRQVQAGLIGLAQALSGLDEPPGPESLGHQRLNGGMIAGLFTDDLQAPIL